LVARPPSLSLAKGAKVVVSGRRKPEREKTVALIKKADSEGIFVQSDVSDEAQVKALVQTTIDRFARLDIASDITLFMSDAALTLANARTSQIVNAQMAIRSTSSKLISSPLRSWQPVVRDLWAAICCAISKRPPFFK
jgi:NAD(P)-dependent dehydrogenase (short-subunit alcohol dehydrogenase family)